MLRKEFCNTIGNKADVRWSRWTPDGLAAHDGHVPELVQGYDPFLWAGVLASLF
jgi:hypothetical protein